MGEELYLIKQGLFEVLNDDDTVHRMLGAGSYFGEIALLCNVHRTMTVRAVTHSLVFVIERSRFVPLMAEYPMDMNQLLMSAALRYRTKPHTGFAVGGSVQPMVADLSNHGAASRLLMGGKIRSISSELFTKSGSTRDVLAASRHPSRRRSSLSALGGLTAAANKRPLGVSQFQPGIPTSTLTGEGTPWRRYRKPSVAAKMRRMTEEIVLKPTSAMRRLSAANGRRGSTAQVQSKPSNPLAFVASNGTIDPKELMHNKRRLRELRTSPHEEVSRMLDKAVISKLMGKIVEELGPSIEVDGKELDELDLMLMQDDNNSSVPANGSSSSSLNSFNSSFERKTTTTRPVSTYQQNMQVLSAALHRRSSNIPDLNPEDIDEATEQIMRRASAPPVHPLVV